MSDKKALARYEAHLPAPTSSTRSRSSRIKPISKGLSKRKQQYYRVRDEWLKFMTSQGQICPVLWAVKKKAVLLTANKELAERSHGQVTLAECHHMRGRIGRLLCDSSFWLAVSADGHRWIHENIEKARELGFVCKAGEWNKVP